MPAKAPPHVTLLVGQATVVEGRAATAPRACMFEDDEATGYFYALETSGADLAISDAMQIYNVAQVTDRTKPSELKIIWSDKDRACALVINDCCHAIFDFERKIGY